MHTKAVFRAGQALTSVGFDVLRFNFRGVGTSTGVHADGIGEEEDVEAALDWLAGHLPGEPLILGGFSFGTRVGLPVGVRDPRVHALLGMGIALTMSDFSFLAGVEKPLLIVQGEEDEFGSGKEVRSRVAEWGGKITLEVIPAAGHYFYDHFDELQESVRGYFSTGLGAEPFPLPIGDP
jgi:alpha/beta superfamily hydrolase